MGWLVTIISGCLWLYGKQKEWKEDVTYAIGWVFWIALIGTC